MKTEKVTWDVGRDEVVVEVGSGVTGEKRGRHKNILIVVRTLDLRLSRRWFESRS